MRAYTLPATVALAMLVTGTLDAATSGLSEREGLPGPSGELRTAATPPAIRKDAGHSRSLSSPRRTIGHGQIKFDGHGPEWWARQSRGWHRKYTQLRRAQMHSSSVVEAVNLACATYGHCAELWSKARCESHLNHRARNLSSGAAGVFQFLRGTWASTPYGRFDVYSPYANALAAGWMHRVGRGGEWSCQ